MKDEKLINDLNILLAQTAEMETEALKKLVDDRKMGFSGSIAYGKAKACDLFIRELTEILYAPKKIKDVIPEEQYSEMATELMGIKEI